MTRIEEIKQREALATPGPWAYCGEGLKIADASFIGHARQDIPYLLRRLEETEKALEVIRETLDNLTSRV